MSQRPSQKKKRSPAAAPRDSQGERLQKVLAAAGIASRRESEQLILEGRVEVDRTAVTELGTRVDPQSQEIRVDGVVLRQQRTVYYAVNKPVGVLCTNHDPAGRTRVVDLVPSDERLFTVGRLDRGSEGLILVTNDGGLANRLAHPRYGVEKTYAVRVVGQPTAEDLQVLRRGVHLAEGVAKVAMVKVKRRLKQATDLEIVLNEGRNREIRRILARVGHKVLQLKRIAIGPLRLAKLPAGASRRLTTEEIRKLQQATRSKPSKARPATPRRSTPKGSGRP